MIEEVCPDGCGATGDKVYRAESHSIPCNWMMCRALRCSIHDELLRPDELTCPWPDEDEEFYDLHKRLHSGV